MSKQQIKRYCCHLLMVVLLVLVATSLCAAIYDEPDKQKHFIYSSLIGSTSQLYLQDTYKAWLVCLGVGVAKELRDQHVYRGFDERDLYADAAGCALGIYGIKGIQLYQERDVIYIGISHQY